MVNTSKINGNDEEYGINKPISNPKNTSRDIKRYQFFVLKLTRFDTPIF